MSAKKATPQKPAAPITSFFTKAPSPSQQQATTGQAAKGAAMAEAATVGVKLNFERPAANEPSNKDSRSPLRTLLPSAPPTEPKSASGASRRVDAEGGPSEETSTRDPPVAATAEGSPVSASVGDAHFMTPAHALRGPQDEDATPGDTPATAIDPRAAPAPQNTDQTDASKAKTPGFVGANSETVKTPGTVGQSASKSSVARSAAQTPEELAQLADKLEKEANAEIDRLKDPAKKEAALADADKDKATTEPGRLLKKARRARARAEKAVADEALRAKAAAEKEAARVAKEQERAQRELEKELAKEQAAIEKAEKAAKLAAEKAEKAAKLEAEKAEKFAKLAREKAEKEAKAAAEKEAKAEKESAAKAAKAEREAKLAAEKAQREKEREDAKTQKEAERAKAEADKRAAIEAASAKKNKQKNQFASFFAKAANKTPDPEPAVVAPVVLSSALDTKKADELVALTVNGGSNVATATLLSDARARWRAESRSFGAGDRWGARRVPKRRRDEGLLGPDKSLQDAVDASVIAVDIAPKRRKLISVQCSSHVVVDGVCRQEGSYRHAFQLGPQDDDSGSFDKTFPVDGGRPAFWGSGVFPERPGRVSSHVTGRTPFRKDSKVEYVADDGEYFDSGDEWEEVEEGESLSDEDVDADEDGEPISDEDEDGFVVKDGELSEGEGVKDEGELGHDPMDLDDLGSDDEGLDLAGAELETGATDSSSSGFRNRALSQLVQWTKQARRRNQPLVIADFGAAPPGTPEAKTEESGGADGAKIDVLRALAPVRFRPGTYSRAAIRMYDPSVSTNNDDLNAIDRDAPGGSGAGKKRSAADLGADANSEGDTAKKGKSEFPDELLRPLVEFLLTNPKLQSKGAREKFTEVSQVNGAHPDLTKKAVQRKIAECAEYRLTKPQRWEIKPQVFASVNLSSQEADAMRPEDGNEFPDELVKPLLEFLLTNPKLQSKGAREKFLEVSQADGAHPDLTKAAVQRKVTELAEYKGRRWEIKPEALAAVNIAFDAAEAMRPPHTPTKAEKAAADRAAKEAARDAVKAANMAKAALFQKAPGGPTAPAIGTVSLQGEPAAEPEGGAQ